MKNSLCKALILSKSSRSSLSILPLKVKHSRQQNMPKLIHWLTIQVLICEIHFHPPIKLLYSPLNLIPLQACNLNNLLFQYSSIHASIPSFPLSLEKIRLRLHNPCAPLNNPNLCKLPGQDFRLSQRQKRQNEYSISGFSRLKNPKYRRIEVYLQLRTKLWNFVVYNSFPRWA
jgi:hypothetical protein